MEIQSLFLIFGVGIGAGFLNVIAGGGSLLVLPILVFAGLPIDVANATNRIGILLQNIVAIHQFRKKNVFVLKDSVPFLIPAILGAIGGSFLVINMNRRILEIVIAVMISIMAGFLVFKPQMWEEKRTATVSKWLLWIAFLAIGAYGGFIQAGVGFFLIWGLVGIGGLDLLTTNAVKVTIIAVYTTFSLAIFFAHGIVNIEVGLILSGGNMIGAVLGTKFAVAKGNRALRMVLMAVVIVSAVKMLYNSFS